jgi:hypothetical protein
VMALPALMTTNVFLHLVLPVYVLLVTMQCLDNTVTTRFALLIQNVNLLLAYKAFVHLVTT